MKTVNAQSQEIKEDREKVPAIRPGLTICLKF